MQPHRFFRLFLFLFCFSHSLLFSVKNIEGLYNLLIGKMSKNYYDDIKVIPDDVKTLYQEFFTRLESRGENIKWYDILGVAPDAPDKEIKKAYHALMRQAHSDKVEGLEAVATIVTNAYSEPGEDRWGYRIMQSGENLFGELKQKPFYTMVLQNDEKAADFLENLDQYTQDFKRFYMLKYSLLAAMVMAPKVYKKITEHEKTQWVTDTDVMKKMSSLHKRLKPYSNWFKSGLFAAFGLYPLYRFRELSTIDSILNTYRSVFFENEGKHVFYNKEQSHTEYVNGRHVPYYTVTYPIGYMSDDDMRKETMPARKNKTLLGLTCTSTVALLAALLLP